MGAGLRKISQSPKGAPLDLTQNVVFDIEYFLQVIARAKGSERQHLNVLVGWYTKHGRSVIAQQTPKPKGVSYDRAVNTQAKEGLGWYSNKAGRAATKR